MGGGQDRVQHAAAADLARLRPWLAAVIADGGVVFAVCAGLQLLGRRYVAADGSELTGLGLLDLETLAAKPGEWRLIGNVVAEVVAAAAGAAGRARRAALVLGRLREPRRPHLPRRGAAPRPGAPAASATTAATAARASAPAGVIATYLHGPVLPKNAWLTDHLLALALAHAGGGALAPLAHPREDAAQREAVLVAERDAARRKRRRVVARQDRERPDDPAGRRAERHVAA